LASVCLLHTLLVMLWLSGGFDRPLLKCIVHTSHFLPQSSSYAARRWRANGSPVKIMVVLAPIYHNLPLPWCTGQYASHVHYQEDIWQHSTGNRG
jgi:hypothetical protein